MLRGSMYWYSATLRIGMMEIMLIAFAVVGTMYEMIHEINEVF